MLAPGHQSFPGNVAWHCLVTVTVTVAVADGSGGLAGDRFPHGGAVWFNPVTTHRGG